MSLFWEAAVGALVALAVVGAVRLLIRAAVSWMDQPIRLDAERYAKEYMDLRWEERTDGDTMDIEDPVRKILRAVHDVQARQVRRQMVEEATLASRWPVPKFRRYHRACRRLAGECETGCGRPAVKGDKPSQTFPKCSQCMDREFDECEKPYSRFPAEMLPLPEVWNYDEPSNG